MREERDRSDRRTSRARSLRKDTTPAEKRLWAALRVLDLPPGHFRRQAPIGRYIADFVHYGSRLVVELDGDQHGQPAELQRDAERDEYLTSIGFRVLRFWNYEVSRNCRGVVETILAHAAEAPPTLTLPTTHHLRSRVARDLEVRGGRDAPSAGKSREG
jgi:very-short-patch-repair endonuclease